MTNHFLTITDLPHLEVVSTDQCVGGDANASTATYAGSGTAAAAAVAAASGDIAITRTRTNATVRQGPYFSMSRATAFAAAFSYSDKHLDWDISFSSSVYFGPA